MAAAARVARGLAAHFGALATAPGCARAAAAAALRAASLWLTGALAALPWLSGMNLLNAGGPWLVGALAALPWLLVMALPKAPAPAARAAL